MRVSFACFCTIAVALLSNTVFAQPKPSAVPATVDVCLMGAVLRPTRANGDSWQPFGKKETPAMSQTIGKVTKGLILLASAPALPAAVAAATVELFAPSVLDAVSKPRVYGTFEMTPDGVWDHKKTIDVASESSPVSDFQPAFNACFKDMPFSKDALFRVHLFNKHTVFHNDDISNVVIKSSYMAAIYRAHTVHHVIVADQDRGQLLTVSFDVSKGVSSAR